MDKKKKLAHTFFFPVAPLFSSLFSHTNIVPNRRQQRQRRGGRVLRGCGPDVHQLAIRFVALRGSGTLPNTGLLVFSYTRPPMSSSRS